MGPAIWRLCLSLSAEIPPPVVLPDAASEGRGAVLWAHAGCVSWLVSVAGLEPCSPRGWQLHSHSW